MQNQTLRQRVEQLFGLPAMKMPWSLYIAQLNEAGKLTARSIMDIMTIVLTSLEEQEQEIKDMKLMAEENPKSTVTVTLPPETVSTAEPVEEPKVEVVKPEPEPVIEAEVIPPTDASPEPVTPENTPPPPNPAKV